jgi:hypothetical protein
MGSDLSFSDRLLVASHTAQAFVSAGGLLFGVGTVLLFGSISYAGIAVGFLLATALAFFVLNCFAATQHAGTALTGAALLALTALLILRSGRGHPPGKSAKRTTLSRSSKGLFLAVIAGLALGLSSFLTGNGLFGDLGVGAYGAVVLFSVAAFLSTIGLDLLLFNLPIEGSRLPAGAYFRLSGSQHARGMVTGLIWAIGLLSALLAGSVVTSPNVKLVTSFLPAVSFAVSLAWVVAGFRERSRSAPQAQFSVLRNGILILVGLVLYAFALSE